MTIGVTIRMNLANIKMNDIIIRRWFWNDKEVTKEEHDELESAWKRSVEDSEKESEEKPKRKKR